MSLATLLLAIALVVISGAAIYLWVDRKDWIETAKDAARTCGAIKEAYKDLDSFARALDDENAELTVKCSQYEALLKTRLDEIPVADIAFTPEAAYPSCRGKTCWTCDIENCASRCDADRCASEECCETCAAEGCPYRENNDISFKKPCCTCENVASYAPAECFNCNEANGYENYKPMEC